MDKITRLKTEIIWKLEDLIAEVDAGEPREKLLEIKRDLESTYLY